MLAAEAASMHALWHTCIQTYIHACIHIHTYIDIPTYIQLARPTQKFNKNTYELQMTDLPASCGCPV